MSSPSTLLLERRCCSVEETHVFAAELSTRLVPGMLVGLSGGLGAGKTELVRGLVKALGIEETVSSPSFVLEAVYERSSAEGIKFVHHWDLYRLGNTSDPTPILEFRGDPNCITLIEWPERVTTVSDLLDIKVLIEIPALTVESPSSNVNDPACHEAGMDSWNNRLIHVYGIVS